MRPAPRHRTASRIPATVLVVAVQVTQLATTVEALDVIIAGQDRRWFRGQGCHHRRLLPSLCRRMPTGATTNDVIDTEAKLIIRFRQRSLPWWPEGHAAPRRTDTAA